MNTIAISELQKSPKKALEQAAFSYILSNNKKRGMLLNEKMMEWVEQSGLIEEYEDWVLMQQSKDQIEEAHKIIESGDYSETYNLDDLHNTPNA